jgi:hypothetical protein
MRLGVGYSPRGFCSSEGKETVPTLLVNCLLDTGHCRVNQGLSCRCSLRRAKDQHKGLSLPHLLLVGLSRHMGSIRGLK